MRSEVVTVTALLDDPAVRRAVLRPRRIRTSSPAAFRPSPVHRPCTRVCVAHPDPGVGRLRPRCRSRASPTVPTGARRRGPGCGRGLPAPPASLADRDADSVPVADPGAAVNGLAACAADCRGRAARPRCSAGARRGGRRRGSWQRGLRVAQREPAPRRAGRRRLRRERAARRGRGRGHVPDEVGRGGGCLAAGARSSPILWPRADDVGPAAPRHCAHLTLLTPSPATSRRRRERRGATCPARTDGPASIRTG